MRSRGSRLTRAAALAAAAFVTLGGLAGCWEDAEVTIHQPGQYKGVRDPLLSQPLAQRESTLAERFNQIQARM